MNHQGSKMNIHITMGSEEGLQFLVDTDVTVTSNPPYVSNIIAQSKIQEEAGNDPLFVFHFYVEQGKQKEAIAYINQALDENIADDLKSPLQKLFYRPSQQVGILEIIQNPGCIILKFQLNAVCLNEDDFDVVSKFETEFDKYQKATFRFTSSLKGKIKHNNKNRTNVKVDYVDLNLFSDDISPSDYVKIMNTMEMEEDEFNFLMNIPVFKMIGNLKSAQFEMKLASFRQLKSYYLKANPDKLKQKENKPFPYVNRGIFRNQITMFITFKNKIAMKFDSHYNGEDVLMRLLKVYEKFFKSIN